jgi:two-component system, cell cycle sensor histidine kinase and response regulator CckA
MQAPHSQLVPRPAVLLVEDSDSLRQNIQEILERAGFFVLVACNATQALRLAQSCPALLDLLITKLHSPEMPGPELARLLRKSAPEMSVIYSSANPLATLEVPDPDEVVSSMLPRPFSKEILLRRINTLLAAHS